MVPITDNPKADKELLKAITKFTNECKEIAKKYPNSGIGDTAIDEEISGVIYEKIHFSHLNKKY